MTLAWIDIERWKGGPATGRVIHMNHILGRMSDCYPDGMSESIGWNVQVGPRSSFSLELVRNPWIVCVSFPFVWAHPGVSYRNRNRESIDLNLDAAFGFLWCWLRRTPMLEAVVVTYSERIS